MKYLLLPLGAIIYLTAFYTGQQGMYQQGYRAGQYSIVLTALENGRIEVSDAR